MGTKTARESTGLRRVALAGLAVLALLVAFVGLAFGQSATGTITGTITDPKGLAVAGVDVLVRDTDTGLEKPVMTNDSGIYNAPLLQPGNYEVTAMKGGFATVDNKNIVLQVGQTIALDMQMPLQSQQALVTVTTEAPLVETEKTEQSQTVSENLVNNLPIAARRWEDFVLLTPAVTADGASGLTSFRGISGLYNNNSVDGANNNQAFFSEARGRTTIVSYVYSGDSIKEFTVANSNYSAEFGQAVGGQVNAVTKSGTNLFHGDVFENVRNQIFNALDPISEAQLGSAATQSVRQQNQYGGSLGGPLVKDKLFFFITYDGFRKVNPITYLTSQTNPTIPNLTCPATSFVTAAQCAAAKTFIDTDELGVFARDLRQDIGFGKLDYQLNQNNHLDVAFNLQDWLEPYAQTTAPTASNSGATTNAPGGVRNRFLIGSWTTTISNDKVNELRYQWGRDFEYNSQYAPGPGISISNEFGYGAGTALPRIAVPDEHRNQVSDNFSFEKGKHAFKTGLDFNFIDEKIILPFAFGGSYAYSNPVALPTGNGCPTTTSALLFCDWLFDLYGVASTNSAGAVNTGKHYSTFQQAEDPFDPTGKDDFPDDDYAAYFQDSWKARPNLTINLGLRYDIQYVPPPPHPATYTPLATLYTSTLNIDNAAFQPRLGIAWNFAKNNVLRIGFGVYYGKTSNSVYYALRDQNGVVEQTFNCNPASTAALCQSLTFPNVLFPLTGLGPGAPFNSSTLGGPNGNQPLATQVLGSSGNVCQITTSCEIRGMDPNFVNPRADEGEVTYERQLPGNMSLTASYLITRGLHLPGVIDANIAPSTATRTYDIVNSAGATTNTVTVPFYTTRIDPTVGVILVDKSVVNSWYNGMVLSIRKPLSQSFEVLANYTLSKSTDDGAATGTGGTFQGTDGVLDPYNLRGEIGRSDLDQRNRFVGSVVWTPDYFNKASSRVERGLLTGWAMSGIVLLSNGSPYSAYIQTSQVPAAGGLVPLDGGLTGGVVQTQGMNLGGHANWLPRNGYDLPSISNVDMRLARQFSFHERYAVELRAEAFNMFNNALVTGVNTNAFIVSTTGACAVAVHTNTCLQPVSTFGTPTTTTSILYGPRQLQFSARFDF
jgi:hypothetical protein